MNILPAVAELLGDLDFDPAALKARYLAERDKRLRPEGIGQYVEVTAEFSRYVDDPYVEPGFSREPVFDEVDFAIIGGGFGGLLLGARLRELGRTPFRSALAERAHGRTPFGLALAERAHGRTPFGLALAERAHGRTPFGLALAERAHGFERIRVVEKAGDFGGTWYWNRYPGAMCDVESYCYLPLLEELGYIPRHKYSFAPEILEHSRRIARHFRLYDDALLQTGITALEWDDAAGVWVVSTDRGDRFRARYVAMANGPLSRPKLPGIPGINEFRGYTFHTSRWDYRYTGGDASGGLTGLADKRVGIIGTGATAIQCIPHLGEWSKQLYVFQRTPSSVDVRNNAETDPAWAAGLAPGWQRARMENFNTLVSGGDQDEDLVHDGWTDIFRNLTGTAAKLASRRLGRPLNAEERAQLMELADYRKMNQIRARVDAIVEDPATAAALKPWYRQFCKRPCFHDEYLETYNRPNVTLVDTDGRGVERLTERGVVANGREHPVDCLIFATGFEVGTSFTRRAGYDIVGRGGRTLSQHWSEGLRTLHGLTSHGFPNCFFLGFTQTAITVNVPHALNEQARHAAYLVTETVARGKRVIEPTAEAERDYVAEVHSLARMGERFYAECTPGYYNSEGAPGNRNGFFSDMYGAGPIRFFEMLADWRADGRLAGMMLS